MTPKTLSTVDSTATHPKRIALSEWQEILKCRDVCEAWGLENNCTPTEIEAMIYGVKFQFMSGGPGYFGDLFILQGDSLEKPMVLIRRNEVLVQPS